ncbi:ABC transporter substrate-binding protein [Halotalea alkalilenta]|uniref:ABC transporter substrate-binding protein n=1 Tax=Halotalea alkalilenta TaxID=376489 RepID=UPI00247FADD8|nr:ABC transporter substrate-binding protein [Halotalea alkalilenta]
MILTALASSTSIAQAASPTLSQGRLTIGSDLTYPPYAYMEGDQPAGFDPDFMRAMAGRMGLTADFVDTRFASLITGLRSHRFDLIASALFVTPERGKVLDFVPYLRAGESLLVLTGAAQAPEVPEQLCGLRVGSIQGASWTPKLEALSASYCVEQGKAPIRVQEYDTDPQTTQALLSRAIDVQMSDAAVAKQVVERLNGRVEISSTSLIYPVLIGLGVNKGDQALLDALDAALAALRDSGEYQALLERYNLEAPSQDDLNAALAGE